MHPRMKHFFRWLVAILATWEFYTPNANALRGEWSKR